MDPSRGDSRYNLNYSMSSIGLSLADQADMYGNPTSLGGRPPSAGILQGISGVGGGPAGGLLPRSAGNLMSSTQCQSLGSNNTSGHSANQQRGLKRGGTDCYEDSHHRVSSGSITSLQGIETCGSTSNVQHSQQQPQSSSGSVQEIVDESYNNIQSKKSPPANGKKTKGRVKIKMEYIDNKLRRYTTFSKRKTGIMKKAYELSTLTGTQVMLLVASETGHVYTFATRKLQPMITSEAGKQLIQTCLNSPDPPSVGGGDQRMSATGFEETELSYNIADEDSKEIRSPVSSINDSDESSDLEGIINVSSNNGMDNESVPEENIIDINLNNSKISCIDKEENNKEMMLPTSSEAKRICKSLHKDSLRNINEFKSLETRFHPTNDTSNVPQNVLLQLIEAGHLKVHTEEDGSGHQYVAIPIPSSTADRVESASNNANDDIKSKITLQQQLNLKKEIPKLLIKEEY